MSAAPAQASGAAAGAASATQRPFQTKLVLLGEAAVGKSSVVLRFVSNEFAENKEPTIGAAFLTQKCRLDSAVIKFEIWDTAGQERFHSLAPMYYRNAQASAVVYDVTKASSFEKAKSWVKELQRQANPNIVIALVGNKLDLLSPSERESAASSSTAAGAADETSASAAAEDEDDETATATGGNAAESNFVPRAVPRDEAESYAQENGLLWFETSAKTGEGVVELFTEIAKKIPIKDIEAAQQRGAVGAGAGRSGAAGGAAGTTSGQGGFSLNNGQEGAQGGRSDCAC